MSDFHKKCDNISNTLMLIKTNKNFVFGGFTQTGWKNDRGSDIYDDKAFCFSLNLKKIYNIKNPKNALHCQVVHMPQQVHVSPVDPQLQSLFQHSRHSFFTFPLI